MGDKKRGGAIIPAIDIIEGRCVRLEKGDYSKVTKYSNNPLTVAKEFEALGITRLHIVDLDGARCESPKNLETVANIGANTKLKIQFGGGIKDEKSAERAFDCGVDSIILGTVALSNPPLFQSLLQKYGGDRVILGVDLKEGQIAINGWREKHSVDFLQFIESYIALGINRIICTDISKDGMLKGAATELYKEMVEHFPTLEIVASGGVSKLEEAIELIEMGVSGVIVGKAFYEERIDLKELKKWIEKR
ncbi:MAG: 1-(5-phosphoribosyl)-5-[(5-phosphoribosylamino)methylideneamino]imidazole-4-carboxamide isomerase [Bacteroidales bacterium]